MTTTTNASNEAVTDPAPPVPPLPSITSQEIPQSSDFEDPIEQASPQNSDHGKNLPRQKMSLNSNSNTPKPKLSGNMLNASGSSTAEGPSSAVKPTSKASRLDRLYEQGKESARRRRVSTGRTPEQQGCTFKPKTNTQRRRSCATSPASPVASESSRFEALYDQGMAAKARLEASKKQAEEASTPSFKPKINQRRSLEGQAAADGSQASGSSGGTNGFARFDHLYEQALEQRRQLTEKQKHLYDLECTFRPQTNASRRSSRSPRSSMSGISQSSEKTRQERLNELYNHAKLAEEKRKKLAEQLPMEYSFKPRTNVPADAPRRSSDVLYPDRSEQAAREARLEELRRTRELEGCTFSPSLETRSTAVAPTPGAHHGTNADVHARLYEQARLKAKQRQSMDGSQEVSDSSTAVSPTNRRLSHDSAEKVYARLYQNGKDWALRKAQDEEMARQRQLERDWDKNAAECTFAPNIPESSRVFADRRASPESQRAADGSIFDRLYAESVEKRAKRGMGAADQLGMEFDCTFHPRISEHSKVLAARRHSHQAGEHEAVIRSRLLAHRAQQENSQKSLTGLSESASLPDDDDLAPLSSALDQMALASEKIDFGGVELLHETEETNVYNEENLDDNHEDLNAEDEGEDEEFQYLKSSSHELNTAPHTSSQELLASMMAEDAQDPQLMSQRESSWEA